jgi:hypothetical protein
VVVTNVAVLWDSDHNIIFFAIPFYKQSVQKHSAKYVKIDTVHVEEGSVALLCN